VFVLSTDEALRQVLESVFRICSTEIVLAATAEEAEALTARRGLVPFELAIVDTTALGATPEHRQRLVCQLWRTWTAAQPDLPWVFIGTESEKYAVLAMCADTVRFVAKPLQLGALLDAVWALFPPRIPRTTRLTKKSATPGAQELQVYPHSAQCHLLHKH
jgi:DNA-binding NtrC family response regulator